MTFWHHVFDIMVEPKTPPSDHAKHLHFKHTSHKNACNSDTAQNIDYLGFSLLSITSLYSQDHPISLSHKYPKPLTFREVEFRQGCSPFSCPGAWTKVEGAKNKPQGEKPRPLSQGSKQGSRSQTWTVAWGLPPSAPKSCVPLAQAHKLNLNSPLLLNLLTLQRRIDLSSELGGNLQVTRQKVVHGACADEQKQKFLDLQKFLKNFAKNQKFRKLCF